MLEVVVYRVDMSVSSQIRPNLVMNLKISLKEIARLNPLVLLSAGGASITLTSDGHA